MYLKKPKLIIIGCLPPPFIGPYIATKNLIKANDFNSVFDIIFLDTSDNRNTENIGQFDLWNLYLALVHIFKFINLVLIHNPKIVYLNISQGIWGYSRDIGFILPSIIMKKKFVLHLRGSEFGKFYATMPLFLKWITRKIFKNVTQVIVLGNKLKKVFGGLVDDEKIKVIPNGINYHQFDLKGKSGQKVKYKNIKILFLSSLRRRKGIFVFLQSLPYVLQQHNNVSITIAGEWRSDSERLEADTYILQNSLNKNIKFIGQIFGLKKIMLYNEHDLFVFPPIMAEGLPWVILEAMSASLPVISTDQGAITEVVEDGKTGFIVEPTPEAIARTICFVIENSKVAKKMGEKGRKRIEMKFSEKEYHLQLIQTLQHCLIL